MGTVSSHTSSTVPSSTQTPAPLGSIVVPPLTQNLHLIKTEPSHLPHIPASLSAPRPPPQTQQNETPSIENRNKEDLQEFPPEDDGYRWRKYGRKNVKGNQFPRSYYKCTHPACQVKKQVETVIENDKPVIHTTYKGEHCHEPPQVTRLNAQDQASFKNSVLSEFLGGEGEAPKPVQCTTSRPVGAAPLPANPRLVVETTTGVDYLDDGYHWRKYGQKNVKGSPYPRSYYKCTEKNCPVKKQVEQCGPLGTTIINTYEGTHNHLAPGLEENPRKRRRRRKPSPASPISSLSQGNDSPLVGGKTDSIHDGTESSFGVTNNDAKDGSYHYSLSQGHMDNARGTSSPAKRRRTCQVSDGEADGEILDESEQHSQPEGSKHDGETVSGMDGITRPALGHKQAAAFTREMDSNFYKYDGAFPSLPSVGSAFPFSSPSSSSSSSSLHSSSISTSFASLFSSTGATGFAASQTPGLPAMASLLSSPLSPFPGTMALPSSPALSSSQAVQSLGSPP